MLLRTSDMDPPLLMMLTAVEFSLITVKWEKLYEVDEHSNCHQFECIYVTILETWGPNSLLGYLKEVKSPPRNGGICVGQQRGLEESKRSVVHRP